MKTFSIFALCLFVLAAALPASAADGETEGWYSNADLGGVWTAGNSESSSLGAAAKVRRVWSRTELTIGGGATQTQSTRITRTATGTVANFNVNEDRSTEKTAEYFSLMSGLRHDISARFFVFGGVDWMKNEFAGIDSRTLLAGGAGNTWWDRDDASLRTFYNVTYTFEQDVIENPFVNSDFAGLQFGYNARRQLTTTTRLLSDLVVDWNLDNSDDVRANWYAAVPVSISSRMELKPAVRVMWRNDPAYSDLALFDSGGVDTGLKVPAQLDEFDTIFTLALVVKFAPTPED